MPSTGGTSRRVGFCTRKTRRSRQSTPWSTARSFTTASIATTAGGSNVSSARSSPAHCSASTNSCSTRFTARTRARSVHAPFCSSRSRRSAGSSITSHRFARSSSPSRPWPGCVLSRSSRAWPWRLRSTPSPWVFWPKSWSRANARPNSKSTQKALSTTTSTCSTTARSSWRAGLTAATCLATVRFLAPHPAVSAQ